MDTPGVSESLEAPHSEQLSSPRLVEIETELRELRAQARALTERIRPLMSEEEAERERLLMELVGDEVSEATSQRLVDDPVFRATVFAHAHREMHAYNLTEALARHHGFVGMGHWSADPANHDFARMQQCPVIGIGTQAELTRVAAGIRTLAPVVILPGRDSVMFDIMEYTLSQYGSYNLEYWPESDTAQLLLNYQPEGEQMDLDSALHYILKRHYYKH